MSEIHHSDDLNDLGYEVLRFSDQPAWALPIFQLNTELFPKDGNLWDSLGEGYFLSGYKTEAIRSYERALELATDNHHHWKKNSKRMLKKIKRTNP